MYYTDNQKFNHLNRGNKTISIFGGLKDPRSHINQLDDLIDIFLIGIISVIFEVEIRKQMTEFANSKEDFLRKFLKFKNGIPY